MPSQKYAVNQYLIETILAWVKSGEIAIPEIQRPFVWDAAQVRDLIDSLYQGYPIGYIIYGDLTMAPCPKSATFVYHCGLHFQASMVNK